LGIGVKSWRKDNRLPSNVKKVCKLDATDNLNRLLTHHLTHAKPCEILFPTAQGHKYGNMNCSLDSRILSKNPKDQRMSEDNNLAGEGKKIEVITYSKKAYESKTSTLRMVMRLALGGAIIGREELKRRFQEKQSVRHVSGAELNKVTPIETETDRARYAAIGALAKSSDGLRRWFSSLGRAANRTYGRLARTLEPVSDSRLLGPFRRRYQRYTDRGDQVVAEWVAAGRKEEYLSRQLAEDTTVEVIEETLDYLAESPEMDELIQAQTGDLVEDVFDDIQESATNTTLILSDWFTTTVLRRPRRKSKQSPPTEAETQDRPEVEDSR
jgi:hypothetical protein